MNAMSSILTPAPESGAPAGERIAYAIAASPLGEMLVARSAAGICSIRFGPDRRTLEAGLAAAFPKARLAAGDAALADDLARIIGSIEDPATAPDLVLDLRGTAFQRKVWAMLLTIPAGTTVSYGELAGRLGEPGAVRAVAGACAANRLALAVPCHRVVRRDGDLAGYRWGVDRKRSLLEREAAA